MSRCCAGRRERCSAATRPAALVHFISKRPTDELDGYVDLSLGQYEQIKAEAAIGGPISDTVSGRLSAAMNKHDGWTENRFEGAPDYNEGDSRAFRAQLQWEPSDATRILLSGNYSDNDAAVGAWQHQATTIGPNGEHTARARRAERCGELRSLNARGGFPAGAGHRLLRLPRHGR